MHKMCIAIFIPYVNTSVRDLGPKSGSCQSVLGTKSAFFLLLLSSAVFFLHVLMLGFLVQICSQLWKGSVPINRIWQDPGISCFYLSPKEGKCFSFPLSPSKNPMTLLGLFLLRKDHSVQEWHAQATCAQKELLAAIIFPTLPLLFPNTALILTHLKLQNPSSNNKHREAFTPFGHSNYCFFSERNHSYHMNICFLCTQINLNCEHNRTTCLCKRFQQCCSTKPASSTNCTCE